MIEGPNDIPKLYDIKMIVVKVTQKFVEYQHMWLYS